MDTRNAWITGLTYFLIYFAAPVVYLGVVQAGLCDKLGASKTVANLPASAYLFGSFAPILVAWIAPQRWTRPIVVWSYAVTAALLALVSITLFLPFSNQVRIAAVVGQGLVQGVSASIAGVYMYQCLRVGTTLEGRARAYRISLGIGPLFGVVGSLGAQLLLSGRLRGIDYPTDFAILYLIGVPCMAGAAALSAGYRLVEVPEEPRKPLIPYLRDGFRAYLRSPVLALAFAAYFLWYFTLNAMPNLSLYTREALHRDPKEFSGIIMALRFGFKSVAGLILPTLMLRWGSRATLAATVALLAGAILWAWTAPGYAYLLAFGLMGAGELGGGYFPNYAIAVSTPETAAVNLSILTLVTPASSIAPVLHGALTDHFGFRGSFTLGMLTAVLALWLVARLPRRTDVETKEAGAAGAES
jgi:MFS family permease